MSEGCRQYYYNICRSFNLKANSIWAMKTFGDLFLVESNEYNFMREISSHCGWCAKTDAIIKYDLSSAFRETDLKHPLKEDVA